MALNLPDFTEGQVLSLDDLKEIVAAIRQCEPHAVEGGGLIKYQTSYGSFFRLATIPCEVKSARAPSTGIAARSGLTCGSATCQFYNDQPTNYQLSGETATVYNDYRVAVSNNGEIRVVKRRGLWWVLTEECNTTQGASTGGTSSSSMATQTSGGKLSATIGTQFGSGGMGFGSLGTGYGPKVDDGPGTFRPDGTGTGAGSGSGAGQPINTPPPPPPP